MPWKILFFLIIANHSLGQFMVTEHGLFTQNPFFDPAFIKRWKIKNIVGDHQYKKDNDVIRERMERMQYSFDRSGRLKSTNLQQQNKRGLQQTDVAYRYDRASNLTAIRQSDPYGFYTVHFVWDHHGNPSKHFQTRTDINPPGENEKLVWKDSIHCQKNVCIYYNDAKKAYKEKMEVFDSSENSKEIITKYYRGNSIAYRKIWYDKNQQIIVLEKKENFPGSKIIRFEYAYDSKLRVEKEDYFENGEHIYTRKLSYTGMQGYPELNLIRYHKKKYIDIIQYKISFFE